MTLLQRVFLPLLALSSLVRGGGQDTLTPVERSVINLVPSYPDSIQGRSCQGTYTIPSGVMEAVITSDSTNDFIGNYSFGIKCTWYTPFFHKAIQLVFIVVFEISLISGT